MKEIIDAVSYIKECAGGAADVKMGVVKDESLANEVVMTVVATGIVPNYDLTREEAAPEPKTVVSSTTHTTETTHNDIIEPTSRRNRRSKEDEQPETLFDDSSKSGEIDWDKPAFLQKGKKITTELV